MDMDYKKFMAELSVMLDEKLEQKLEEKLEEKLEQKLEQKFEEKLAPIRADLIIIKEQILTLSERMDALEKRMDALEKRMDALEKRVDALEKRMDDTQADIASLKDGQARIWAALDSIQSDVHSLQTKQDAMAGIIENEVRPNIQLLAENYVPAARRYEKAQMKQAELETEVGVLKLAVADHSRKIKILAEMKA